MMAMARAMTCPAKSAAFYGQDAQYSGNQFSYTDNGNGTVTDNITGLMWQQTPNSANLSWQQAGAHLRLARILAGQSDWRTPSLKELFSISDFSQGWPYLNTTYFHLAGADVSKAEQYWSSNDYAGSTVEGRTEAAFGVNHGTGHIKAYPAAVTGPMGKHVRCVRGDSYGVNQLVNNSNGTITDQATGLMWSQTDSGAGLDWEHALAYAQTQNAANYLGHNDWRLPNVKELQSLVDYTRAPGATNAANEGAAIDPMFQTTGITNEAGVADYPYYWTSTSALFQAGKPYYYAWYVAFGRAVNGEGLDFHGAGAVRFDTKEEGGPAGEGGERYYNYVRLVRGGNVTETPDGNPIASETRKTVSNTSVQPAEQSGSGGRQGSPGGQPGGPGGQPMPDLAAAATKLGVTEDASESCVGRSQPRETRFCRRGEKTGYHRNSTDGRLGCANGWRTASWC